MDVFATTSAALRLAYVSSKARHATPQLTKHQARVASGREVGVVARLPVDAAVALDFARRIAPPHVHLPDTLLSPPAPPTSTSSLPTFGFPSTAPWRLVWLADGASVERFCGACAHRVVGIDSEWKPGTELGVPTAVVQLAVVLPAVVDVGQVVASHSGGVTPLPATLHVGVVDMAAVGDRGAAALAGFLADSRTTKAGHGWATADHHRLRQSLPASDLRSLVDVDTVATASSRQSLSSMVAAVLHHALDKTQQCSAWEARPLSDAQLTYAGLDAWATLALFHAMCSPVEGLQWGGSPPTPEPLRPVPWHRGLPRTLVASTGGTVLIPSVVAAAFPDSRLPTGVAAHATPYPMLSTFDALRWLSEDHGLDPVAAAPGVAKSMAFMRDGGGGVLYVCPAAARVNPAALSASICGDGEPPLRAATPDECVSMFGFPPGYLPAVAGYAPSVATFVDASLLEQPAVFIGCGVPSVLLVVDAAAAGAVFGSNVVPSTGHRTLSGGEIRRGIRKAVERAGAGSGAPAAPHASSRGVENPFAWVEDPLAASLLQLAVGLQVNGHLRPELGWLMQLHVDLRCRSRARVPNAAALLDSACRTTMYLASTLGMLAHRLAVYVASNFDSVVPTAVEWGDVDHEFASGVTATFHAYRAMEGASAWAWTRGGHLPSCCTPSAVWGGADSGLPCVCAAVQVGRACQLLEDLSRQGNLYVSRVFRAWWWVRRSSSAAPPSSATSPGIRAGVVLATAVLDAMLPAIGFAFPWLADRIRRLFPGCGGGTVLPPGGWDLLTHAQAVKGMATHADVDTPPLFVRVSRRERGRALTDILCME